MAGSAEAVAASKANVVAFNEGIVGDFLSQKNNQSNYVVVDSDQPPKKVVQIYTRKKLETRKMPRPAVVKKNVNKQKKKRNPGRGPKSKYLQNRE